MFFLLRTSQFQAAIDARDRKMQFDVKKTRFDSRKQSQREKHKRNQQRKTTKMHLRAEA